MKKIILIGIIAILFSCKKEKIVDTTIQEDGVQWLGFKDVVPASSLSELPTQVFYWDTVTMRQLTSEKFSHDGSKKTLYLVQVPGDFSLMLAEADLKRRGYKIAPLAYGVGLIKQYTTATIMQYAICLDIPKQIDFGNGNGPEPAALFIQQTSSDTYMELVPKKTSTYGSWVRYVVYR